MTSCRTWGGLIEASATNTILCHVISARSRPTPDFFPRTSGYLKIKLYLRFYIYLERETYRNRAKIDCNIGLPSQVFFVCSRPVKRMLWSWCLILASCTLEVIRICTSCTYAVVRKVACCKIRHASNNNFSLSLCLMFHIVKFDLPDGCKYKVYNIPI